MHALEPTIKSTGISKPFAGLVIVAIAGNAVEHAVGVVLAHKGQPELAIAVVKNSVAQVAAFLYPLLVLVSLLTATTLTFALAPVYTGALLGTAIICRSPATARRRRSRGRRSWRRSSSWPRSRRLNEIGASPRGGATSHSTPGFGGRQEPGASGTDAPERSHNHGEVRLS